MEIPNRVVISCHWYSWDYDFSGSYEDFKDYYDYNTAFIMQSGNAPMWLGEFGTDTNDNYWQYLIRYLGENPDFHWAYWAYNGYQENKS